MTYEPMQDLQPGDCKRACGVYPLETILLGSRQRKRRIGILSSNGEAVHLSQNTHILFGQMPLGQFS
jgi:hypothetical protein